MHSSTLRHVDNPNKLRIFDPPSQFGTYGRGCRLVDVALSLFVPASSTKQQSFPIPKRALEIEKEKGRAGIISGWWDWNLLGPMANFGRRKEEKKDQKDLLRRYEVWAKISWKYLDMCMSCIDTHPIQPKNKEKSHWNLILLSKQQCQPLKLGSSARSNSKNLLPLFPSFFPCCLWLSLNSCRRKGWCSVSNLEGLD